MAWTYAHLPLTFGIAASGAAMVGLVEHATDARTPAPTAWLVSGSVAITAVSLAAATATMLEHPGRRLAPWSLTAAAGVALVLAALRPAPWLLALGLYVTLTIIWREVFIRHARAGHAICRSGVDDRASSRRLRFCLRYGSFSGWAVRTVLADLGVSRSRSGGPPRRFRCVPSAETVAGEAPVRQYHPIGATS